MRSDILWDLAAVYPPGSIWSDRMPPAVVFNGPVVDVIDVIEDALARRRARLPAEARPTPPEDARSGMLFVTPQH